MTAKPTNRPASRDFTDTPPAPPSDAKTAAAKRVAKGAAQEVIGKLIGDDAVVNKGRAEQRAAKRDLGEDAKR